MMKRKLGIPRRQFLATTGAVMAAPYFVPATALALRGRPGANDRLTVAHIGVGGMGGGHLQRMTEFRAEGRVNIAAVCDVDEAQTGQRRERRRRRRDALSRLSAHLSARGHRCRRDRHARSLARRANGACVRNREARLRRETVVGHDRGRPRDGHGGAGARTESASRRTGSDRVGRLLHVPRDPQRDRGEGEQGHLLALREPGGWRSTRRAATARNWTGICGWDRCAGAATTRRIVRARFAGSWNPAVVRSAIAERTSSVRFCGA